MAKGKSVKKKKAVDFSLLMGALILVFIGIIMVFSSSWPEAMQDFGDGYHFLKKQIIAASVGLVGMIICMNIDYKIWKKYSFWVYLLALISGALIFSPLGKEAKGARRWINLGFTTFMPSDAIKIGSIIYFANFLSNKKEHIRTLKQGTIPALIIIGISCGFIYVQKDLGTTITLAGTLMSMFFIAGMNLYHLIFMGVGAVGLGFLVLSGPDNAYRRNRITAFRDPFAYKLDIGWQAVQSLYALGSGGLFGLGLGKSRQKFSYIPESYNDFIFSIIGEELGFLGTLTVILILMLIIWRGIRIALSIDDSFGCFLASGITALVTVQSLIHIAVVTSSIPTTGITLPFVSYGGTSLMIYMSAIGILLNISRHANLDRS
ncbi:putative lipid II flippase FtsW [Tissierella carlieri]|jgi:cell division protein FtsW|uniref:putative lipid II flippase FtsW n=1 Tax=Tissierella TaxID=41273 RepID=UPI000BA14D27|nr:MULTISPECIES: putative lipid II flippase FtsW [Tissierella]MBU5313525.1 putative lipid II flippase FtsW [Tissierella carlieri]OZV12403.1 putative lipid II flippase FtsW [Tissierella sp. P1]